MPAAEAMQIRTATLDDAAAIAALSSQLGYPTDAAEVAHLYASILPHGDHAVFLAEDEDGAISGWAHVFLSRRLFVPTYAELGGLVVDETRRESGIGRALLERAERWAVEAGCSLLRIRTNVQRTEAHRFYARMGYTASKAQHVLDKKLSDLRLA
jgi:GNAT superfamily N-acetyltransferase